MNHISQCSKFHERIARLEALPSEVQKLRDHAHDNREAIHKLEARIVMRDER